MNNQDKIINKIKSVAQKAEHQDFPGMEKVWARVDEKLDQRALQSKNKLWKKIAIAASVLLFVSLGYQLLKTDSEINSTFENNDIKVVIQKNETSNDSVVPSKNIKIEAVEILEKQLEKKNPVVVVKHKAISPKDDNEIILDAKAEESNIQTDGIISQESNNSTLSAAPMALAAAKSLVPVANEYKEKAEIAVAENNNEKTISGVITDENDNLPIPGALIQIKGTQKVAVTDLDGKYTIEAVKGEQLIFNMIGYNSAYAIVEKSGELNKKLNADSSSLDEVVVIGYGTVRKRQAKNAAPIAKYGTTKFYKVEKAIKVPHIKNALYIINDVEFSETDLFGPNPTSPYAPLSEQKIENLEILSKKESISKYGEKGKNKVIIITTQNGILLKR